MSDVRNDDKLRLFKRYFSDLFFGPKKEKLVENTISGFLDSTPGLKTFLHAKEEIVKAARAKFSLGTSSSSIFATKVKTEESAEQKARQDNTPQPPPTLGK